MPLPLSLRPMALGGISGGRQDVMSGADPAFVSRHPRPNRPGLDLTLAPAAHAALMQIGRTLACPARTKILQQGRPPQGIFLLREGRAKLLMRNKGRTVIVRIARPGDLIAAHNIFMEGPSDVTVETTQQSQLDFFAREAFHRFLQQHADAALWVLGQVSRQMDAACELTQALLSSHTTSAALSRLLLEWADAGQVSPKDGTFRVPLTHREIAQSIGRSRETVTRKLNWLMKRKVLGLRRSELIVLDQNALEALAL